MRHVSVTTVVLGEQTATSLALTVIGGTSQVGIADAAIDMYGSAYSHGVAPSIYQIGDWVTNGGVSGQTDYLLPGLRIQYGDKQR